MKLNSVENLNEIFFSGVSIEEAKAEPATNPQSSVKRKNLLRIINQSEKKAHRKPAGFP